MLMSRYLYRLLLLGVLSGPATGLLAQFDEAYSFGPGESGVEEILTFVLNADKEELVELTRVLQPEKSEYAAVFTPPFDKRVWRFHRRLRRYSDIIVHPLLRKQTEYLYWSATTEELQNYVGGARNFPGGYREVASYLRPELTFYRFKFVEPGHKLGSAYDVLVYVKGHWRIFHRPWAVLVD